MSGRTIVKELATKSESVYGVTETGSPTVHKLVNDTLTLDLRPHGETLEDESTRTSMHDHHETVLGSQYGGTIQGTVYGQGLHDPLTGGGGGALNGTSETAIMKAAMGASVSAAGSTVVAGVNTTLNSVEVGAAHGARFGPNRFAGFVTASGPGGALQVEVAIVRKVVGDVVFLDRDLASVPAGASIVYNSVTLSLDADGVGLDGFTQMLQIIGENPQNQWIARGGVPMFDIDASLRGLLKLAVNWRVNNASPTTGLTIGAAGAPVGGHPLAISQRIVYCATAIETDAAAARIVLQVEDIKMSVGLALEDEGGGGVNSLYCMRQVTANPMANIVHRIARNPTAHAAFRTDYAAHVKKNLLVQHGVLAAVNGRGGIFCFAMPRAQFDAHVKDGKSGAFDTAEVALGKAMPALNVTGGDAKRNKSTVLIGQL